MVHKKTVELLNLNNVYQSAGYYYVKGSHHRIKIPDLNKDLALFLGLIWGDGWIVGRALARVKQDWKVGLVEDDAELLPYVQKLIKNLFFIDAHMYHKRNYYYIVFSSRIVYELLNQTYNFPDGEKKDRLHIPKQILSNSNLSKAFLNGLFSTDGCLTFTKILNKKYPRISFSSASSEFAEEVFVLLKSIGFSPHLNPYNRKIGNRLYTIRLNGIKQVSFFHKEINFVGDKQNKLENIILNSPVV